MMLFREANLSRAASGVSSRFQSAGTTQCAPPSIQDLIRIMVLVFVAQALLTDQHVLLVCIRALMTHPGGYGLAPLALARLAILILRLVLGYDAWIRGPRLQCDDLFQGESVLDPVSKIVHVLQCISWPQP